MAIKAFRVEDMHCPTCVMRLESLEDTLPGVIRVDASYRTRLVTIKYDENRVREADIIARIVELGYTPERL